MKEYTGVTKKDIPTESDRVEVADAIYRENAEVTAKERDEVAEAIFWMMYRKFKRDKKNETTN